MRQSMCPVAILFLPHPFATSLTYTALFYHSTTIGLAKMAEVVDMASTASPVPEEKDKTKVNGARPPKAGRKTKFTPQEDLIITHEVSAPEAHLAPHGETHTRF